MSDAMRARDALFELLCFDPMTLPLTVLLCVVALAGAVDGVEMRLPGDVGAVLTGGSTTSMINGIGVLLLVCGWWTRGVLRS